MTKEEIVNWIDENANRLIEDMEWLGLNTCNFEYFFENIEELKLEDSEKNIVKKMAKLLSIYVYVKEFKTTNKDENKEIIYNQLLQQIRYIISKKYIDNFNINFHKIIDILKNKYNINIPLYEIFDDDKEERKIFWKIYYKMLNEEEKIKIINDLIKNNKFDLLKQLNFNSVSIKFFEEDKDFQKNFIKTFYKIKKRELFDFLEKVNKDKLTKDIIYFLVEKDKKFIKFASKKYIKEDNRLRKLSLQIQGLEDPLILAKKVKERLKGKIFGQDHIIEKIADAVKNKLVFDEKSPRYVFSFFGPSATGKTHTAKLLQEVFEDYKYKQFDMSLYEREDSGLSLIGSDFKFGGSASGELTEFVLNNPKSIIVFDEIEKCHPQIQKQLLTIFSEGYLEDKFGWCKKIENGIVKYIPYKKENDEENCSREERINKVSFKDTIIVFTSNAGENLYSDNKFWKIVEDDFTLAESMIIDELKKEKKITEGHEFPAIDPALLSRISSGEIVLFKELNFESIYKIAKKMFKKYNEELKFRMGVRFESKDLENFIKIFLLKYFPILDIRRIKNKIANDIYDYISDEMLNKNYTFDDFETIELKVSKKAKSKFQKILKEHQKIKEYFFRKNLTADLKVGNKFEKKNKKIIFTIKDFELKKFTNIRDMKEDLLFDIPEIKFDDIVGHEYVKTKLKQIVLFLKNAKKLQEYGVKMPKGMLLYGPPGTGKTMLAKALASEADLPFFATTGSDIKSHYRKENGEYKLMMDRIFQKAKKYAPSIIFIDEIDALGNRSQNPQEADIINKFLTLISGFDNNEDDFVFIIAASNYPDRIDEAILRSGRIDLHVKIDRLDKEARKFFIKRIIKKLKGNEKNFNIEKLAIMSFGMSGADFEKLTTEIGIYMIINQKNLDENIFIKFINEIKYGKEIEVEEELLRETAYHEAGHAISMKFLLPQIPIEQATIVARENTLGFVSFNFEDLIGNMTKEDIYNRIKVALAGRIAQNKKFKKIDTGAANDIEQATLLAKVYVSKYGFDEKIGNVNLEVLGSPLVVDEEIKNRVIELMKKATKETEEFVNKHWDKIEKLANALIEKEIVTNNEIEEIVNG